MRRAVEFGAEGSDVGVAQIVDVDDDKVWLGRQECSDDGNREGGEGEGEGEEHERVLHGVVGRFFFLETFFCLPSSARR